MTTHTDVAALVARRKQGFTLEAPFYTSQAVFQTDLDLIYGRHWVFVASEPEIAEAGDYVTVKIGRNSVIIARGDDMQVRAFHNVCRHRGSKLVLDDKGFVGNIVCPYHQWTYDLTGRLIHAEQAAPCVEPEHFGLKPVHLKTMSGLIFICLAEHPPGDFDEVSAILTPYLAQHDIANLKVAAQDDYIENGNWKLTIENNRECYHCSGHPELLQSLFHFFGYNKNDISPAQAEYFAHFERTQAEYEKIWEAQGLPWQPIEQLHRRATGFRTERLAMDGPGESFTDDARIASRKLINGFTNPRLGSLHLHMQPNSWFHFLSDHAITFSTLPLAPDRTLVRTTWLVHKDAVEGVDYDLERLTKVWKKTNQQDGNFVSYAQEGANSQGYEPGPYSPTEYMVDNFCSWYTERLAAEMAR